MRTRQEWIDFFCFFAPRCESVESAVERMFKAGDDFLPAGKRSEDSHNDRRCGAVFELVVWTFGGGLKLWIAMSDARYVYCTEVSLFLTA